MYKPVDLVGLGPEDSDIYCWVNPAKTGWSKPITIKSDSNYYYSVDDACRSRIEHTKNGVNTENWALICLKRVIIAKVDRDWSTGIETRDFRCFDKTRELKS